MSAYTVCCAHAFTLDGETCGREPAVHIAMYRGLFPVSLPSCRRHAGLARVTFDVIAEHDYRPGCEGGRCWPLNDSRVRDDRQQRSSKRLPTTNTLAFWFLLVAAGAIALAVGIAWALLALPGRPL